MNIKFYVENLTLFNHFNPFSFVNFKILETVSVISYYYDQYSNSRKEKFAYALVCLKLDFQSYIIFLILCRTLARGMNKSIIRVQDSLSLLAQIVKVGYRKEVWDFVVNNYDEFKQRFS